MSESKNQTIPFVMNFYQNQKLVHSAKCDFKVENHSLDFKKCSIVAQYTQNNHDLRINELESVDVNMTIAPKTLAEITAKCAQCTIKHCER